MRKLSLHKVQAMPEAGKYVDWIQPWVEESLHNCLRFLALALEPFEKFNTDGCACLLADGSGSVEGRKIGSGTSFGIIREALGADSAAGNRENSGEGIVIPVPQWFKAETECVILCFNTNIFNNICFGLGCGSMHTRIREMILDSLQYKLF